MAAIDPLMIDLPALLASERLLLRAPRAAGRRRSRSAVWREAVDGVSDEAVDAERDQLVSAR
jgi:hypothetical protein